MTPTNKPSSADLRHAAEFDLWAAGKHDLRALASLREQNAERLLAGADAMDSLAAMREQRDRLAEALRRLLAAQAIGSGVRLSMMGNDWTTGEERDATEAARAAIQQATGEA